MTAKKPQDMTPEELSRFVRDAWDRARKAPLPEGLEKWIKAATRPLTAEELARVIR